MSFFKGTTLALSINIGCSMLGIFSDFELAIWSYCALSYLIFIIIKLTNYYSAPPKDLNFYSGLTKQEERIFIKYHTFYRFPKAGELYSAVISTLGTLGIVWSIVGLVKGIYIPSIIVGLYFFVAGELMRLLYPTGFVFRNARRGVKPEQEEAILIQDVLDQYEDYQTNRTKVI